MSNPNDKQVNLPIATVKEEAKPVAAEAVDLVALLKEVNALKKAVAPSQAKAAAAAKEKEIDWTKITESDIVDLSIPIPVYEQETPAYLNVKLLDQNYVPRWIHTMVERLGPALSSGYSYVEKEDLDPDFPHPLQFDVNNHYSHGDVVCLKIQKQRYYGAIKRNYLKTMAIHGKAKMLERIGEAVKGDERLSEAIHRGAMNLYEPGDMKGQEVDSSLFSQTL
jgi:hypothetical protein